MDADNKSSYTTLYMSLNEQTLTWLEEVPEDSEAWRQLATDAQLLHMIAAAEAEVRAGKVVDLDEVTQRVEAKWKARHTVSN